MTTTARCSVLSAGRAEPIAGTATTSASLLLLEEPGPWGRKALRDARLPEGLGAALTEAADAAGVKVLLVRRPARSGGRPESGASRRVFTAHLDPNGPRLETAVLGDVREVLDLDLAALASTGSAGLEPSPPVYAVCTHGQRDACCAELGRPVVAAVTTTHPEETWEVSHLGGHRFAANLLALPTGYAYGRLDPDSAVEALGALGEDRLVLDLLRGRSGLTAPVQVAEVALRRHLGEERVRAVLPGPREADGEVGTVRFDVAGAGGGTESFEVQVRSTQGHSPVPVSCGGEPEPVTEHEVLSVRRRP